MESNKPLTVKELFELCKQEIKNGHGDCSIMLSDDDEGNGYHYLYYNFQMAEELFAEDDDMLWNLDESIAPKDKTIVLG